MQVRDILKNKNSAIHSISPEDSVLDAIRFMTEKNVGGLVVLEQGRLCGIITERDYRSKIVLQGRTSQQTPVKDIMTSKVQCVSPEDNVYQCMALMTENRFRHAPVMENDELVGIVSIGDLVKAVIEQQQHEIDGLRDYITGTYPK